MRQSLNSVLLLVKTIKINHPNLIPLFLTWIHHHGRHKQVIYIYWQQCWSQKKLSNAFIHFSIILFIYIWCFICCDAIETRLGFRISLFDPDRANVRAAMWMCGSYWKPVVVCRIVWLTFFSSSIMIAKSESVRWTHSLFINVAKLVFFYIHTIYFFYTQKRRTYIKHDYVIIDDVFVVVC